MHAALVRERERIDEMVADEAKDHVERARARAAIEAAELRRLADDDVRGIEAWAAREIRRIRREAARKSKERRADMASYLLRHEAIIDTEIAGLETAVADYGATPRALRREPDRDGKPGRDRPPRRLGPDATRPR